MAVDPEAATEPDDEGETGDANDSLVRELAAAPDMPVPADLAWRVGLVSGVIVDDAFRIEERLGTGGMGVVYAARDLKLDREVALKVVRLERTVGPDGDKLIELFQREARATARLNHPNVVTLHQVGDWNGLVYLVLERLRGETLQARLERGPMPLADGLAIVEQVVRALVHTHAAGIVHRDLKPSNVFLVADGVKVLDFGVSALALIPRALSDATADRTPHGVTMSHVGTPGYMAPEQWRGEPQDERTDLWAVGALLHVIAVGRTPFGIESLAGGTPPLGDHTRTLPPPLAALIAHCLAPRPEDRPGSAAELLERVSAIRTGRRRRWPWLAGATAIACLAGGIAAIIVVDTRETVTSGTTTTTPPPAPAPTGSPRRIADLAHTRNLTHLDDRDCAGTPAFADASTVVFDLTRGEAVDLYRVPIAGGAPAPIARTSLWEWHANRGRRPGEVVHLVSSMDHPKRSGIAYLDLATGVETTTATLIANDVAVAGDALYYTNMNASEVRRIRNGHDEVVIAPSGGGTAAQLDASPTGDAIAYAGRGSDGAPAICVLMPGHPPATCMRGLAGAPRPAFAADGRVLYYASHDGIIRRELATGVESIAVAGVDARGGIAVGPDGGHLVYSDCGVVGKLFDVSTSPPRPLVGDATAMQPAFGPGGALAWTQADHDADVLHVRLPDGRQLQLTTPSLGSVVSPAFSADGRMVVFAIEGGQGPGLYAVDVVAGATAFQLTSDAADDGPVLMRDGRVAFTREGNDGVRRAYLADPHARPTIQLGPASRVVVGVHPRTGEILLHGESLTWFDATTRSERPGPPGVGHDAVYLVMSPSARWIVFQTGLSARDVWRMKLDPPTPPERVYTAPTTLHRAAIDDLGHVAVSVEGWSGDLYVVPAAAGSRF